MEDTVNDREETIMSKDKKKKRLIFILLLVLIIVAAGGGVWWYMNRVKMDDTTKYWFDKMAQDGSLEGKTPQELQGMLDQIVEEGMFNVSMNVQPVFENGESEGSLGIANIKENLFYCKVILTLDEDGSVLYESDGIKPGQYIDKVKLAKVLKAGKYDCTAQYIVTDPDTLDDVGKVNVKVLLTVIN
jgi:hypothetical protein